MIKMLVMLAIYLLASPLVTYGASDELASMKHKVDAAIREKNYEHAHLILKESNSKGAQYFNTGDYSNALKWFKIGADRDPFSNYCLGKMYIEGKGVQKNIEKGLQYLRKPAEHGHRLSLKLYCKYASEESIIDTELGYNCREAGF